jgi:hypothetical protein
MAAQNNLLISLHKMAQDENFVTEAFSNLLQRLLDEDSSVAVDILEKLTNGEFPPKNADARMVRVRTQVSGKFGRPDVELSYGEHKVVVEVKLEAGLGEDQLGRYQKALAETAVDGKYLLVLLSRHAVQIETSLSELVIRKRWFQVVQWLKEHQSGGRIHDVINQFLTHQFVEFAEYRCMTIEKVGSELVAGLASARNLCSMIQLWIEGRNRTFSSSFGRDWAGFYTNGPTKDYFVGIHHNDPRVLVFENEKANLDHDGAAVNDRFRFVRRSYGARWCQELVLNTPEDSFFALSRDEQIVRVEQFLSSSLSAAEELRR